MNETYYKFKDSVEKRLKELFIINDINKKFRESMFYSVMAGGKRLRPVLNLLGNSLLDGNSEDTLDNACAIEMIHTYSLIHDDLPAMDNDELRRGKPTNHVMFGEDFAILAGDGLLTYAFETILKNALGHTDNLENQIKAAKIIANAAGIKGMVCGQCADVEAEGQILSQDDIDYIHKRKTGAMITGSILSGLILCSPDKKQIRAAEIYGDNIGLAFQIIDDILDITGSEKELGKSIGKDNNSHKFTYPVLYGVDKSFSIAKNKTEEAIESIKLFGNQADSLISLASEILVRKK